MGITSTKTHANYFHQGDSPLDHQESTNTKASLKDSKSSKNQEKNMLSTQRRKKEVTTKGTSLAI